jgi:hypothetical protein
LGAEENVLLNKYYTNNQTKTNEMDIACSKGAYKVLVGKPEGKRPLGRPRRRLEDDIKVDLHEGGGNTDCIDLDQNRDRWRAVVIALMKLRVP